MKFVLSILLPCRGGWLLLLVGLAMTRNESAAADVYIDSIRPILAKHCLECHGENAKEKRLRIDRLMPDFAGDNGRGTLWFHGRRERMVGSEWRMGGSYSPFATRYSPISGRIIDFSLVFSPFRLDSRRSAAISPRIRRGISRAACFCANSKGG